MQLTLRSSGLCVQYADLPTADLHAGAGVQITFYWRDIGSWEGADFLVDVSWTVAEPLVALGGLQVPPQALP